MRLLGGGVEVNKYINGKHLKKECKYIHIP